MTMLLRIFAWLLAAAVTFATLGPPWLRPQSSLSQDAEHALAFIVIGLAFGAAYSRHRLLAAAVGIFGIGAIELLQLWAPGRHARFEDFAVDAAAACSGLVLAAALDWALQRSRLSRANAA